MTLYKRILAGVLFISFCLIGLIYIDSQLILLDSYQHLEEQNATQNMRRVVDALQGDIDNLRISDIGWYIKQPTVRMPHESVPNTLLNRVNLDAKLNVSLLLNSANNIVYKSAIDTSTGKSTLIPQSFVAAIKPGNPLFDSSDSQATIKGIITLPDGMLMAISVPVYASNRQDGHWGRLIGGRYIDEKEVNRLAETTKLDITIAAYNDNNIPTDFLRAKNKLDAAHLYYVEPMNNQLISGYTSVDDIYGKPAMLLRAQMPRFIYQYGQDGINTFFVSILIIVAMLGAVVFLLLERTILSRLNNLNVGLVRAKSANALTLEVLTTGNDEITSLTSQIKEIFKGHAETKSRLRETLDNLEKQVMERTVELTNANARLEQELGERKQSNQLLTQARDKALGELQLKSELLTNVSHDARTPLSIIRLNTEMLQQGRHGELNSKQTEVLDRILNATRQLHNFITNMLDEAQLKHGKMPFVNVTFEPRLLIEELVTMLAPLAESKGITLNADFDLAIPNQMKGDPDRLKQILSNLSENAIKFTDHGSVTIKAQRTDRLHWTISVIDTGRGIPPEAQSRIFEAYWQLNSTLKRDSNRGVGLGLSIVKQIVQLMKGNITVTSRVGEGTTFTVTLPIEENSVPESVLRLTI